MINKKANLNQAGKQLPQEEITYSDETDKISEGVRLPDGIIDRPITKIK